jgi:tetratricopeptide (TPR) repeat protein
MADDETPADAPDGAARPDDAPADDVDEDLDAAPDQDEEEEDEAADRYKRGVAIALALLAVLGAWVAVLQSNGGTNESSTTREATRLAAQAQSASIVEEGGLVAVDQVESEIDILGDRPGFTTDADVAADLGIPVDSERDAQRLADGRALVENSLGDEQGGLFELSQESRRLALAQDAKVHERVTWNARASQYETVLTVLGVALFLIGFTAVVGRKLRPPLAVPGMILALFCFGWALWIYNKPIPFVSDSVIDNTAEGEALLAVGNPSEAEKSFSRAIAEDDEYLPAHLGRAQANLLVSNPDIYRSLAFTDTESEAYDQAVADLTTAIDLGGDTDVVNLTTAAMTLFGRGDYERATLALETAMDVNDAAAIVPFARSAAAVADGDGDAARHWRDRGVELLGPLEESDRNREVSALCFTMLAKVADDRPEHADLATEIIDETVAFGADIAAGDELSGEVPDGAAFEPSVVTFADDETTVDIRAAGIPDGAWVTVLGWERPAEGASWVQTAELFYTGQTIGSGALTIDTPRNCDPVEWRFDLYVNGAPADSMTLPGVAPTC